MRATTTWIIVALSIGMGVIPIAVPTFYEHFPNWFQTVFDSGISSAAVTAVLLNLLYNVGRSGTQREAALVAESPTVGVTPDYDVPGGVNDARDTADDGGRAAAPRSRIQAGALTSRYLLRPTKLPPVLLLGSRRRLRRRCARGCSRHAH